MDAKVTWKGNLVFEAVADSEKPILLDTKRPERLGPGPMELIAMGMAGCTAMDVISILEKKKQNITRFEVKIRADRAAEHPMVFTQAELVYEVTGHNVDEAAVRRAIELSVQKYCPAHAMMRQVFPIRQRYVIYEDQGDGSQQVVAEGEYVLES